MWQSKKDHTSFVKSFLHHEPESGSESEPSLEIQVENPNSISRLEKGRKAKAKSPKDLIDTSSYEEVSLKVLGI